MNHKKWKKKHPAQAAYSESFYGLNTEGSLERKADRAAAKIYRTGIAFRGGRVSPGTNNVMADFAAAAFTGADLEALRAKDDPRLTGFAEIIALRQDYNRLIEKEEEGGKTDTYWLHTDRLEAIEQAAERLIRDHGWKPPKAF